jgi:ABC-type polysaccharide transport system permease subunit
MYFLIRNKSVFSDNTKTRISGIDQSLYEAATVDGAGRFQKMRHITLPGLLPTFFVLLLMAIAGCLSNGLDQYLVFRNPNNMDTIRVLDLWVYDLGINGGSIPLSTVIGMAKSVVSVALLFGADVTANVNAITLAEAIAMIFLIDFLIVIPPNQYICLLFVLLPAKLFTCLF